MKGNAKISYFGTDGIRGRVGGDVMNSQFMLRLGRALGKVFADERKGLRVVLGKDTRVSGYMLESALESGLLSSGADVLAMGVAPTPCISYVARNSNADLGVVISASHNPYTDNGIKVFDRDGNKLSSEIQDAIEDELQNDGPKYGYRNPGRMQRPPQPTLEYEAYCQSFVKEPRNFANLSIVLDCANGAAYKVAQRVFEKLGLSPIYMGVDPDGTNINEGCGSTDTTVLQRRVVEEKADLGIAFDGDGDRLIMIDEFGEIVDGDEIVYAIACRKKELGTLIGGVVGTHMTNLGLELALAELNIPFVRADVGDRYIMETLREKQWTLGGETSGHIINLDACHTGDAIISALQILEILGSMKITLSELVKPVKKLPQVLINVSTENPKTVMSSKRLAKRIDRFRSELGKEGRILIRPSGTEPLVRVMVEGRDRQQSTVIAEELSNIAKSEGIA